MYIITLKKRGFRFQKPLAISLSPMGGDELIILPSFCP